MSDDLWLAVIQAGAAVITAAISVGLPVLLMQARKKYALEITAAQEAQLTHAAREAVRVVEELAAARAKAKLGSMLPAEKFTTAVANVVEKLPAADRADVERKVIAALPDEGLGALNNPPPAPEQ